MTFTICLLDPSLADNEGKNSNNLGDLIIAEAVIKELASIPWLEKPVIRRISTHVFPGNNEMRAILGADLRIIGGSNLLSGNLFRKRQWRLTVAQHFRLQDITLMGVGWWQYMSPPTLATKLLMARPLTRTGLHSVRDSYTREQLGWLGYSNAVNTSCPTVWSLGAIVPMLPTTKGTDAIFTLTDYNRDPKADANLITALRELYDHVFFWPQGARDLDYASTLNLTGVSIVEGTLTAYDDLLAKHGDIDFIGTRLHGGIRAMQHRRRALILAVDNRAAEISKDTGIPTVARANIKAIRDWIGAGQGFNFNLDTAAIRAWQRQFAERGFAHRERT